MFFLCEVNLVDIAVEYNDQQQHDSVMLGNLVLYGCNSLVLLLLLEL